MNWRAMRAITRRDLKIVRQSKAVLIPLIIVPLVILVALPAIGGILLSNTDPASEGIIEFQQQSAALFDNLPASINAQLDKYDNELQRITYIIFNLFFPSMYLILPTMVANVIAADSFAGEKERKTLEALIYTPTTDREYYLAKLIGPWATGIVVSWLGYIAFAIFVTLTTISFMGEAFVINATWLLLIFWVTPAAAGIGLGTMVLVSSRVSTFQEAYQLGGVVVVPIILIILGQVGGLIYFSPIFALVIGALLWILTMGLIWYGAQTFKRSELIARL